jgi:hypothetical protein
MSKVSIPPGDERPDWCTVDHLRSSILEYRGKIARTVARGRNSFYSESLQTLRWRLSYYRRELVREVSCLRPSAGVRVGWIDQVLAYRRELATLVDRIRSLEDEARGLDGRLKRGRLCGVAAPIRKSSSLATEVGVRRLTLSTRRHSNGCAFSLNVRH